MPNYNLTKPSCRYASKEEYIKEDNRVSKYRQEIDRRQEEYINTLTRHTEVQFRQSDLNCGTTTF